ncbi:pitrilysin family protein [Mucilaginibacter sp. L196]|uniref:M16 family metallopeptidase n=1 Tax=Mucilaginibacter sp. L196 TaxID=1641870 RepID=UPI0020B11A3A|nr:insulinase family protein [Mucilaginibacter sp. L196]
MLFKKHRAKFSTAALMLGLLIPSISDGQTTKETTAQVGGGNKVLPLDPNVRTGKLSNGFTYYIRHNEEPKNRVIMYLVNKVGSVLEDEDQRGLAHFMEHMSFNGTAHFPHNELINYLQKAGVRFGADINAYTSFDETVYELPLPSDQPAILAKGILIMHDWAQSATLDPIEIDKERGVVLEEKRLGKGAGERMQRQYWPMLLNNSRYAVRIPIGLDTVLDNFKRPAIARFYHDWYRPDLQALIIVGDINADSLEKVVKVKFSDLENPVQERVRTKYTVPLDGRDQFIAVTDKEMTMTTAEVIIKHKGRPIKTTADYRNSITHELFNTMLGERYSELTKQADPPYIQGGARIGDFLAGTDIYGVSVLAKPGELERGFKAVWRETDRVKRYGFTQTELDRAKQSYMSNMEAAYKEKNKTNSQAYVNEYQQYFLQSQAAPGIEAEYNLVKTDLPEITLTEVNDLTKEYIKEANRDIIIMAPDKDKAVLPDETTINSWMKAIQQEKLDPYKDEVSSKPLLAIKPVPGKIIAEKQIIDLKATELTLSNGVKVVVKPTDFKDDEITFTGFAPGGTSLYSDADFQSAANASGIVSAGGVGNYSSTQLEKYLSGKQVNVSPYIVERAEGINGSTTPKDFETALQLTFLYFTQPRRDAEMFQNIINRSKASLANRDNDPNSVFSDTVNAVLGNYSVRRTGPTVDKFNQINLDKAYSIYKERFADASNFTFTFIGSFDINQIKPLLEQYLGSLPATNKHEQAKDLGIRTPAGKIEKTVYKGTEPKATVRLVFSGDYTFNQQNNKIMDAMAEVLEIRLLERLREDESGVYSPGAFVSYNKYPIPRYGFTIVFGCAPQNVEKLITSALDEVNKLKSNGPEVVNVEKFKAENGRTRETQLKTNKFWLNYLNGQVQNQEDLELVLQEDERMKSVTPMTIKEAANKYLSGDNYIRLVLLPETK